ncbi:helix-turn-helix domain-containing protein [Paraliomyxa miuraensis]|uniref:helix-turn-helix domain-containing protein n=1 Tax=Paraliomyxa miuraensis TaxID=376150 RepID=UPI0022509589|nr:XRE family transcriptional regulator [Paraliomyxa miuraensis]MCX4241450.1 XRE family transcriptional regulator [Paraliomyxa miuraensis]
MADDPAQNLALNIKQLREARGATQHQIARAADLPRPTWANLESGAANPTLSVLMKVAGALQVTLEELVGPPRAVARLYRAQELPLRRKGKVTVRRLLPDPIAGMELERMELTPGASMVGVPHTPGTREYLTCESGSLELTASGERFALEPGDVVVFRGDQPHAYRNLGRQTAVAYSVVTLARALPAPGA